MEDTKSNTSTSKSETTSSSKRHVSKDNEKSFAISIVVLIFTYSFLIYTDSSFVKTEKSVIENYIKHIYNNFRLTPSLASWQDAKSVYDFEVVDIDGNLVSLSKYRGKVLLIVNVATNCGLTSMNYPGLQQIYAKYNHKGFSILAFPCNQFRNQEPGSNIDIKSFAQSQLVTFDLFNKGDVNGEDALPLFKYLKSKFAVENIEWNFAKFLVDRDGIPVKRYAPKFGPSQIEADIAKLLG